MKKNTGLIIPLIIIVVGLLLGSGALYLYSKNHSLFPTSITKNANGIPVIEVASSSFSYHAPDTYHPQGSLVADGVIRITASSSRLTLYKWDNRGDYNDAFALIQFRKANLTKGDDAGVMIGNSFRSQNVTDVEYSFADGYELPDVISLNVGDSVNIHIKATLDLKQHPLSAGTYIAGVATINCDGTLCGQWDENNNPIHRFGDTLDLTTKEISSSYSGQIASTTPTIFKKLDSIDSEIVRSTSAHTTSHVEATSSPATVTTTTDAATNKFTSGHFNYSFEYPSTIAFVTTPYDQRSRRVESEEYTDRASDGNLIQFNFDVGNVTDLSLCNNYEQLAQAGLQNGSTYTHVNIDGHTFLKSVEPSTSDGIGIGFDVTYTIVANNICYRFTGSALRQTPTNISADEYNKEIASAKVSDFEVDLAPLDAIVKSLTF